MKQKKMTAIAVGCGLLCAVCVALFLIGVQGDANAARAEALARYGGEQVEVCVAARDIAAGERVDASAIETRLWVADLLPDDPIRTASEVVGTTPSSSILKGEVVSKKRFDQGRASIDVPAGKEAVSVPAKAVQAVGGAIKAGMYVDVYATGGSGTSLIADDVLVLDTSVGEGGSLLSSDSGWITLALDAGHVQEVVAAAAKTDLSFVLPGESAAAPSPAPAASSSASSPSAGEGASPEAAPASASSGAAGEPGSQSGASPSAASPSAEKPAVASEEVDR